MAGGRHACIWAILLAVSGAASARFTIPGRSLLQSNGSQRVSILDDTVASPDLGPRAPPPATTTAALPVTAYVNLSGHHCGAGCIAGSVIGSVVGFTVIVLALVCCWRACRKNRAVKGERTLSQIDLLASGEAAAQDHKVHLKKHQTFCTGNPVFCHIGKCCASGDVIGAEGEEYRVRLFDGSEKTVKDGSLAMNFKEGDSVLYTSPKGGQSIPGTIIASNGNFWPPFYQLQPKDSAESTINTTAECLRPVQSNTRSSAFKS